MGVAMMANKRSLFVTLVDWAKRFHTYDDLKRTQMGFSPISTDSLCLQVAQMPRCQDLAISVIENKPIAYPLHMHTE